eukprot:1161323-Amphidinium_carterae.2
MPRSSCAEDVHAKHEAFSKEACIFHVEGSSGSTFHVRTTWWTASAKTIKSVETVEHRHETRILLQSQALHAGKTRKGCNESFSLGFEL